MAPARSRTPPLLSWSIAHAALLLSVAAAVAAGAPLLLLSACAAISFAALLYRSRGRWTPAGGFGAANAVTFARLAGILALPWLDPFPLACLALALLMLDGVDGWLARRSGLASEFGEFADKESDALLVLMLCLVLYRLPAGLGAWILVAGLLRYVFVLFVAAFPQVFTSQDPRFGDLSRGYEALVSLVEGPALGVHHSGPPEELRRILGIATRGNHG